MHNCYSNIGYIYKGCPLCDKLQQTRSNILNNRPFILKCTFSELLCMFSFVHRGCLGGSIFFLILQNYQTTVSLTGVILQNLPNGLTEPHEEALKPENSQKNRYKNIYPCMSRYVLIHSYYFNWCCFAYYLLLQSKLYKQDSTQCQTHLIFVLFHCQLFLCCCCYSSFVSYRTRFSQVLSYIIKQRWKGSRQSYVTL